jgi:HEAT repeat protein
MGFYDLSEEERTNLVAQIRAEIRQELISGDREKTFFYFSDEDTYIRKSAYLAIGRIYKQEPDLTEKIVGLLRDFLEDQDFKVRQTVINAAGEIGKSNFGLIEDLFKTGLFDPHHSVRNAVIGSVKKMGEVNPKPVLSWAEQFLDHPDKEIRREICHGIELRGRKHPQDILPLLKKLQFDKQSRVRQTLVHVLGQIAYKKGCLEIVVADLKTWENKEIVRDALDEIIDVHMRYANFSALTQEEARKYIEKNFDWNESG